MAMVLFLFFFHSLLMLPELALAGFVDDLEDGATHPLGHIEQCAWPALNPFLGHVRDGCALAVDDEVGPDPLSWRPWTHRPYCADSRYCVFTNSMFGGKNHGVSIITTPEIAASSPSLLLKLAGGVEPLSRYINATERPPYVVIDIPGKGKGVVATRLISRGEVFMAEYPRILADLEFMGRVRREQGHLLLQRAIEQLADSDKVLSLARSGKSGAPVPEDIMRTNTFGITIEDRSRLAIFPKIARMNHACNPNAFTRFAEASLVNRAIAFRDINPGEEITVSYIEAGKPLKERQDALASRWGFHCHCELCTSAPEHIEASDRRRAKVRQLRDEVLQLMQKKDFYGAIALNEELVELTVKENMAPHLGEHYEVLARLYLAGADLTNAQRYARRAVDELEANGGIDVYDSIGELRRILTWK